MNTTERSSDHLFHVGPHAVRVSKIKEGRWTFSVNDAQSSHTFPTAAAAWAAGVHDAFSLGVQPATGGCA